MQRTDEVPSYFPAGGSWGWRHGRRGWSAGIAFLLLTGCGDVLPFDKVVEEARVLAEADWSKSQWVTVDQNSPYQILDLGAAEAGDHWDVYLDGGDMAQGVTLALFDAEQTLLWRGRVAGDDIGGVTLTHDTETVYLGVALGAAGRAADVRVVAARKREAVPAPAAQVVWLNFGGAENVSVLSLPPVDLPAFDAAVLGAAYANETSAIKAEIARTVTAHYAPYSVIVVSSDDGPPPDQAHSILHFGGRSNRYLGLCNHVDRGNQDHSDVAIIYTESFAPYATMELTTVEMGQMIGNTAAHELGHLLGLYHTRDRQHLMDDSRSAWDMVGISQLDTAPLAETVFPWGTEDSALVLTETLGLRERGTHDIDQASDTP